MTKRKQITCNLELKKISYKYDMSDIIEQCKKLIEGYIANTLNVNERKVWSKVLMSLDKAVSDIYLAEAIAAYDKLNKKCQHCGK